MKRPVKRFLRAIAASAASAAIVFGLSHLDAVSSLVVSLVRAVAGPLPVEDEKTIGMLVIAVLSAALQAADKALRDSRYGA